MGGCAAFRQVGKYVAVLIPVFVCQPRHYSSTLHYFVCEQYSIRNATFSYALYLPTLRASSILDHYGQARRGRSASACSSEGYFSPCIGSVLYDTFSILCVQCAPVDPTLSLRATLYDEILPKRNSRQIRPNQALNFVIMSLCLVHNTSLSPWLEEAVNFTDCNEQLNFAAPFRSCFRHIIGRYYFANIWRIPACPGPESKRKTAAGRE